MAESKKGRQVSEETRRKIAESRRGRTMSEETRRKISESMKSKSFTKGKSLTAIFLRRDSLFLKDKFPRTVSPTEHRLKLSEAKTGVALPQSIRRKIAISVSNTKQRLRRERLAARAAAAAEAATADLRKAFSSSRDDGDNDEDIEDGNTNGAIGIEEVEDNEEVLLDAFELERAAVELASLRSRLTGWMNNYENKYGRMPDLTEASETHPAIYALFVRYVALRDLVRRSSVAK